MEIQDNVSKAKEIVKSCMAWWEDADYTTKDIEDIITNACQKMAQWKDEIMKNKLESSVSAEVGYFNQRGLSIYFDKSLEKLGLEEGDKVKVLIIKEE